MKTIFLLLSGLRTRGLIEEDEGASVDDILDRNLDQVLLTFYPLKPKSFIINNYDWV